MTESKEADENTADIRFIWLCRRSTKLASGDILATTSIPVIEKAKVLDKLEDVMNGI